MGFCRRCGDIVTGPRCKCGGTPVAPAVKWNQDENKPSQDRWSRTYVTKEKAAQSSDLPANSGTNHSSSSTSASTSGPSSGVARRFPRPSSTHNFSQVSLSSRVSAHIASATSSSSSSGPPSPLKNYISSEDSSSVSPDGAAGILPNPNGSELAKVYGSILQPQESLATYNCALCSAPFPPDATIYPEPSTLSSDTALSSGSHNRFLCRPCFTENGGSKGECPTCRRPVLILKSEGPFIENGGRAWHKDCFTCSGCFKKIGDIPMVDLLGRPSCAACFDTCLKRPAADSPHRRSTVAEDVPNSNLGGTKRNNKSREGSPALDELEQRLGIARSRENTPTSARVIPDGKDSMGSIVARSSPPKRTSNSNTASRRNPTATRPSLNSDSSPFNSSHHDAYTKVLQRIKSPEPDTLDDSPIRSSRLSTPHYGSPLPDGSPPPRRSHDRFKSPTTDSPVSSPSSRTTGSPRYGSPVSSIQPTEEAIEEMKQRFLRQASSSPSSASHHVPSPMSTSPTRHPRYSYPANNSLAGSGGTRSNTMFIPRAPTSPSLGTSESSHALRSSTRQNATEDPDYTLRRDRTGDAEVESLLGTGSKVDDLIDLESPEQPPHYFGGSLSPFPSTGQGSLSPALSPIGLGLRVRMSDLNLSSDFRHSLPPTPDLAGDMSDATSTSQPSPPSTPPSVSPPVSTHEKDNTELSKVVSHSGTSEPASRSTEGSTATPTPKSKTTHSSVTISTPTPLAANTRCAKCGLTLYSTKHGGKFVTVPDQLASPGGSPRTYHTACFKCAVCNGVFEEAEGGRAVFVRGTKGICHVECAPPERIKTYRMNSQIPRPTLPTTPPAQPAESPRSVHTNTTPTTSSRYERPPPTAPPMSTSFSLPARFGGSSSCPGCSKAVSPMERGVVPGPQGTRWHATCLICGGKDAKGRRKEMGKPGCGKKLDSAAKSDRDGGVWCRECLLLLPMAMRQSPGPVRSPVVASNTGGRGPFGGIAPQHTGTTPARQVTGSDAALMRQMTGGGLSPTRQLISSPTKMFDGPRPGTGRFPRPKSVTGTRSDGEGRGMFLVRQLTGGSGVAR